MLAVSRRADATSRWLRPRRRGHPRKERTVSTDSGAQARPTSGQRLPGHIRLTSHSGGVDAPSITWGASTAAERGPVIATTTTRGHRNVVGTHSGSYSVYRALAVASGALSREHRADLTNTSPTDVVGPYPQWSDPEAIVSIDPWGATIADSFPITSPPGSTSARPSPSRRLTSSSPRSPRRSPRGAWYPTTRPCCPTAPHL